MSAHCSFRLALRPGALTKALATTVILALAAPAALGQPRVLAQRSQTLCQWPQQTPEGAAQTVLLDSAAAWQRHVTARGSTPAIGRTPQWAREQVLLHVLPEQPTMGVRVSALRVQNGPVLVLQVSRPGPEQMAPTALSRPCVWVLVSRSATRPWQVRVQDSATGPMQTHLPVRLDR